MKNKKYIIPSVIILCSVVLFFAFMSQNKNDGDTLKTREDRISEIGSLEEGANIDHEIFLNDGEYIISGYSANGNRHGLAIFGRRDDGTYQFESNVSGTNNEMLSTTRTVGTDKFNFFWVNKVNLDYAEITYTVDGSAKETITINAQNNVIIYTKAPAKDYSVECVFIDKDGTRYE